MKKILVAYSSKHGSTADAAKLLAQRLKGEVTLANLNEAGPDPAGFDIVALGGAVYAGTLPKALKAYCTAHEAVLAQKPLGLFVCCSEASPGELQYLKANLPNALVEGAVVTASFGGEARPEQMNILEKLVMKVAVKASGGQLPTLHQEAISGFAAGIMAPN